MIINPYSLISSIASFIAGWMGYVAAKFQAKNEPDIKKAAEAVAENKLQGQADREIHERDTDAVRRLLSDHEIGK